MKTIEAIKTLTEWDQRQRSVFKMTDLRMLFPEPSEKTFSEGLRRLVRLGVLMRMANGVYWFCDSRLPRASLIETVAVAIRRGTYCYISLESALSEYGVISQVPLRGITVMTTGRKGVFETPIGTIEFTHTQKSTAKILDSTLVTDRPLRFAKVETALKDLRRVGRNMHMVSMEDYHEIVSEQEAAQAKLNSLLLPLN